MGNNRIGTKREEVLHRNVVLTIPNPPSVNEMFGNNKGAGRGRYLTARYKTWRRAAENEILAQKPTPILGPVEVIIHCKRNNPRADIDNKIKAVNDILQHCGVIENDKLVQSVTATWMPGIDGAWVEVRPWRYD